MFALEDERFTDDEDEDESGSEGEGRRLTKGAGK